MNDYAIPGEFAELAKRLSVSRRWVGAQFGWMLAWIWVNFAVLYLFHGIAWLSTGLGVSIRVLVTLVALIVQMGMLRSLIKNHEKTVQVVWGSFALLLWALICLIAAEMQDYLTNQILKWMLAWVAVPAIIFPFAAASSVWGWRSPWRRVLRVVRSWRWWLAIFLAGGVGDLAEAYSDSVRGYPYVWDVNLRAGFKMLGADVVEMVFWILLLGWLAVLFDMEGGRIRQAVRDSSSLPLPESCDDVGGPSSSVPF